MQRSVQVTSTFEQRYHTLRQAIDKRLHSLAAASGPHDVGAACKYVLTSGGKRIRAVLVLLACQAVGGKARHALSAATAVEILHNFTLVHDDVMDNATSRRGKPTVQKQWNLNVAVLSGDILLGRAYEELLRTRSPHLPEMVDVLTDAFLTVCEGQALDLEFESRDNVSLREYFAMIEKKTGRLITAATELGALAGNGSPAQRSALHSFGSALGRAFQLQDDLLDVVAEEQEFGKRIGGDIVEGKRTFLFLSAMERARGADRKTLDHVVRKRKNFKSNAERQLAIRRISDIYHKTGVLRLARQLIAQETRRATNSALRLPDNPGRSMLLWLSDMLLRRSS